MWAKKIFKTKRNCEISTELKEKVKTVFHHLTKEELIEKLLAERVVSAAMQSHTEALSIKKRKK